MDVEFLGHGVPPYLAAILSCVLQACPQLFPNRITLNFVITLEFIAVRTPHTTFHLLWAYPHTGLVAEPINTATRPTIGAGYHLARFSGLASVQLQRRHPQ